MLCSTLLCSTWSLSSLTRDSTQAPCIARQILNTQPPGKSPEVEILIEPTWWVCWEDGIGQCTQVFSTRIYLATSKCLGSDFNYYVYRQRKCETQCTSQDAPYFSILIFSSVSIVRYSVHEQKLYNF